MQLKAYQPMYSGRSHFVSGLFAIPISTQAQLDGWNRPRIGAQCGDRNRVPCGRGRGRAPQPQHATSKDAYFAVVHNLSTIVRRDFYLERTLNRLRLPSPFPPDLALRVIRAAAPAAPLHATRFLAWLRAKPSFTASAEHFDALLLPLARARLFPHLWSLASDMRGLGLPLSPTTFSAVISSYGHSRLPDQAVEVFNRLPRFGCPQTTEDGAQGRGPDRATFSTLVDSWCAAGKLKEAQAFLDDMASRGFRPPVRGRDLLVDGLVRAGHLEEAKAFALRMTKEGILPDVATFNSLAEALCNAGDVDFAVALLADASSRGLCPDISTYKVMLPAVAKVGKIEEAFRLFYAAVEDGHRPFPSLYAAIIKALCKAGRFADAFAFFGDMKMKGHPPNRPVYVMLVKMCVRGGRFVEAANYLVEMSEAGFTPRAPTFNVVVDGLRHCGKHDLARRLEQLEVSLKGN
ncbi:unnamed protein product [Miscanthus lutarioriparius]|uniref:Pentatricopeptide repeat-containing protein n=1 Tax=Miscanthus lutarioriparius TaxID=422564 RepID=A0A811PN27_9POAL|nr:unnamed protein product [Miscanthus lutarioriparius]